MYQNLTVIPGHYLGKQEYIARCIADGGDASAAEAAWTPKAAWSSEDYTIIIGHRRAAAAQQAGKFELPCSVVDMTEKEQLQTMMVENMQRSDLTVYEQAQGFQMMLDMGDTVERVADRSGFSQSTIRRRIKLLELNHDNFKKAEQRGATLSDFVELNKIEDLDARNRVLETLGTANFNREMQNALSDQKYQHRKAEWIEQLRQFAVENPDANYSTHTHVAGYGYWNTSKDVEVPDDADSVAYCYKVSQNQIDLYKERDLEKENAETAKREEKRQQDVMSKSTTFFRDGMRKLFKNPLAVGSLIVLSLIIITIIVAPMIVPYKYSEILSVNGRRDKGAKNMAPFTYSEMEQEYIAQGGQRFPHIFGTDEQCRDYFVRVIYGTRVSLCVGLFASIIVMIIGVIYGSISGYLGGKVDLIMMRIVDIIYSLPDMLMVILLAVVFDELIHFPNGSLLNKLGANMISLFLVFGLLYWVGMARLIRGQILSIKENDYILAAESIGAGSGRIIRKHILPNCISVIIITTALQIPSAIFTESYLSFIGMGVRAPMPSLGSLANYARDGLQSYPYKLVFPALTICLIVLSMNLLGDGLRDAFDPKLKR
mgnify:CR=1 FL=1